MRDELFDVVAGAQANQKGDVFKDGRGLLVVVENIYENMNEGRTFVGKFKFLTTEAKGDIDPVTKQPVTPNPAGTFVGWPQKVDKFKSSAGNVKAYILNLVGKKESELSVEQFRDLMKEVVNYNAQAGIVQPTRGMLIRYSTYQQEVRSGANKGKINTYVSFTHVPPSEETPWGRNTKDDIRKRREELDREMPLSR